MLRISSSFLGSYDNASRSEVLNMLSISNILNFLSTVTPKHLCSTK
ncbi:hypothetical protein ACP4OV_001600 [Aristida adscensionis]